MTHAWGKTPYIVVKFLFSTENTISAIHSVRLTEIRKVIKYWRSVYLLVMSTNRWRRRWSGLYRFQPRWWRWRRTDRRSSRNTSWRIETWVQQWTRWPWRPVAGRWVTTSHWASEHRTRWTAGPVRLLPLAFALIPTSCRSVASEVL